MLLVDEKDDLVVIDGDDTGFEVGLRTFVADRCEGSSRLLLLVRGAVMRTGLSPSLEELETVTFLGFLYFRFFVPELRMTPGGGVGRGG